MKAVAMSASASKFFVVFILVSSCRACSDDFLDALMAGLCVPYYKGRAHRCEQREARGKKGARRSKKDQNKLKPAIYRQGMLEQRILRPIDTVSIPKQSRRDSATIWAPSRSGVAPSVGRSGCDDAIFGQS